MTPMLHRRPLEGVVPERAHAGHPVWREIAPELTPRDFRFPHVMDAHALRLFSRIRRRAEVPFRVISDHRPPERNAAAGGALKSAHMEAPCRAIDLQARSNYERARIVEAALAEGIVRIGIYPAKAGAGGAGSVHLDASSALPAPRIWTEW